MEAFGARRLVLLAFALIACLWGGLYLSTKKSTSSNPTAPTEGETFAKRSATRIVSLSPGVTETLQNLGAAEDLVGVSDFCVVPPSSQLTRAGTALTPNYEVIAKLAPTAIVTSEVKGEALAPLDKLAPTHRLPWLSLEQWQASVLELGEIVGKPAEARRLHEEITTALDVEVAPSSPRVLLAMDYGDSGSDDTWFIRKNSIHGAVLRASGAQNAVREAITGHPKLSPEQLLSLDPDAIIVLTANEKRTKEDVKNHFSRWAPLRAVKNRRIGLVTMKSALNVGPSVLRLVPLLEDEITRLMDGAQK